MRPARAKVDSVPEMITTESMACPGGKTEAREGANLPGLRETACASRVVPRSATPDRTTPTILHTPCPSVKRKKKTTPVTDRTQVEAYSRGMSRRRSPPSPLAGLVGLTDSLRETIARAQDTIEQQGGDPNDAAPGDPIRTGRSRGADDPAPPDQLS